MIDDSAEPANAGAGRAAYAEAAAWSAEVFGTLRASRRTAWAACAGAVAVASLLGAAVASVGPLHTPAPYVVGVERQGAYAEAERRLAPGPLVQDAALTDAFLAQYVIAREAFAAGRLRADYETVALWSDPGARARFDGEITRTNPASPLAKYSAAVTVTPVVKSVSRLSASQALVRFETLTQVAGAPTVEQQGWQATVAFRRVTEPLSNRSRIGNPLGFRVVDYRRDPDGTLSQTVTIPR